MGLGDQPETRGEDWHCSRCGRRSGMMGHSSGGGKWHCEEVGVLTKKAESQIRAYDAWVPGHDTATAVPVSPLASSSGKVQPPPVTANVTEIRAGEANDGPLESTDLYISGRGISLLINVKAGAVFTYSLTVDGEDRSYGTVGLGRVGDVTPEPMKRD